LDALLVERLKLEEIGLKHIDTFDKLVAFCEGFYKFLLSKNPYPRYNASKYFAYLRYCRMYLFVLLKNFKCEQCGTVNTKRAMNFHHENPKKKRDKISRLVRRESFRKSLPELFKCIYVCDECHYQEHLKMGDYYGYFEIIDRWRHPYIQNMLGSTESSTVG
jgi:hypothetical protein